MRRRTLIALIITAIVIFLTNKFWLIFKPMSVDFDIKGNGICNIIVQLNKKDDNNFTKIKTLDKSINLNETNHANYIIKRAKFPKRIRFIIDLDNSIEIKNITLKNGEYKLDDLSKFSVNTGTLKINGNSLIITPAQNKKGEQISLIYNQKLNMRTSIKFDLKIFLVILILSYFIFYKLIDYVANFKTMEHKSRGEIIFLAVFFLLLFVPMSNINQINISENENRAYAPAPLLFNQDGGINYNYGKDFNAWFNDRFFSRKFLLDIKTRITLLLTKKGLKGFIDPNGFIYMNEYAEHNNLRKMSQADWDALIQFNEYLKDHGIELYILLVPSKSYVYPPKNKLLIKDNNLEIINNEVQLLRNKYNINIVNPLKELQEGSKNEFMFYKTEHHWTPDGAFIGYQELMKEINKKHKIYTLQKKDFSTFENNLVRADFTWKFDYGESALSLNLPKSSLMKFHDVNYKYYTHNNSNLLQVKVYNIPYVFQKIYYYPKGADYKVILLGTSQCENLTNFIPFTFKNVLRIRNNCVKNVKSSDVYKIMKYYEKEILDYKPDILIYCIDYEEDIYLLHDLFNRE